jgi:hypothetical protein
MVPVVKKKIPAETKRMVNRIILVVNSLSLEIDGCGNRHDKIEQGIDEGDVNEHVDPPIDKPHEDEDDEGLGANDIDPDDPVEDPRSIDHPIKTETDEKAQDKTDDQKKVHHDHSS